MNGRNNLEYCRMLSSDANDLDRRFGEFCFSQVRKQLKGAYLPEERIYCIEAADGDKNRVESLVRDIIDRGAWPSDDHQRLRDIGFVHETADPYRRTDSRDFIVGELERTLHNGRAGRLLEAYHDFHQSREKDTGNRVLTAIQTGQGVLLFDDTGRGLERAESYLQYNADNFFSPIHRNTDKLGVYYFSTDNARLVEKARECGRMFAPARPAGREPGCDKVRLPEMWDRQSDTLRQGGQMRRSRLRVPSSAHVQRTGDDGRRDDTADGMGNYPLPEIHHQGGKTL